MQSSLTNDTSLTDRHLGASSPQRGDRVLPRVERSPAQPGGAQPVVMRYYCNLAPAGANEAWVLRCASGPSRSRCFDRPSGARSLQYDLSTGFARRLAPPVATPGGPSGAKCSTRIYLPFPHSGHAAPVTNPLRSYPHEPHSPKRVLLLIRRPECHRGAPNANARGGIGHSRTQMERQLELITKFPIPHHHRRSSAGGTNPMPHLRRLKYRFSEVHHTRVYG